MSGILEIKLTREQAEALLESELPRAAGVNRGGRWVCPECLRGTYEDCEPTCKTGKLKSAWGAAMSALWGALR